MVFTRIYNWNPLIQNETKNKDYKIITNHITICTKVTYFWLQSSFSCFLFLSFSFHINLLFLVCFSEEWIIVE